MQRVFGTLVVIAIAAGGWVLLQHFEIEGFDRLRVKPRDQAGGEGSSRRRGDTIRVASFNIQVFGQAKADKPKVMHTLGKIIRRFDLIAIQEVRSKNVDVLHQLVEAANVTGDKYEFVVGPRLGRTNSKEQFAYIFDSRRIEIDKYQLYTVQDPDDVIHREPLVGWFRVRGPDPNKAFTFSLVNVHTDPDEAKQEVAALHYLFDEVRNDGRREDDVIMLGDFNASGQTILQLGRSGARPLINEATNTRGTKEYDNILLDERATEEFAGRSGVFDFLREYNLGIEQALEVSDHLPVWAEFYVLEGGRSGRMAKVPGDCEGKTR